MGWRGNLRTLAAYSRQREREAHRRTSLAAKQYKAMLKQEEFENGQRAVQEYNDYLELISSTHKETSETLNWQDVLNEPEPVAPVLTDEHQRVAQKNLANYKPSFFDNLFGSSPKKIKKLQTLVAVAKDNDKKVYEKELEQYNADYPEWAIYQKFAKGVLSSNTETYKKIIEKVNPFSDIKELGSGLNIDFEKNYSIVTLLANGITVIPDFTLTQTAAGKVSKKKMPVIKFNELYQDYICSCALRVAREIFSFIPIELVIINITSELVNSSTGHLEQQTILSVAMPKTTLDKLNFGTIDPSDSMKNFKHNMKFSKTAGFSVVPNIQPEELALE
ncbi:MAG TPA: hypothetical protein VF008_28635 [Niastella sp.]